jgi:hypothetical protein
MHRSFFTRIVSAVFAFWFAVFTAEPMALHTCPVHDGGAPGGAASHMEHGSGGAMHMSGSMADHASHAGQKGESAPQHAGAKVCQCPGSCCNAAPIALRAFPVLDVPPVIELADSGLPDYEYVAVSRSLLLPFANGPPSTGA